MHITNLPPEAGLSSQSGGQVTVDNGHPVVDGRVPRVASNVRTAWVTPSSMG